MIIVLKPDAPSDSADRILTRIKDAGLQPLHMPGTERVVLGALGDERILSELALDGDPAVESVKPILAPYKLVSRELHPHDTVVNVGGGSDWRDKSCGHCRPLRCREPGTAVRQREGGQGCRSADYSGRCLQAPHLALRLFRARTCRPYNPARSGG